MSGPTIRDIAREANVGTATVERVLNDRGGVRTELAERVIRAAKKLKYGDRRLRPHSGIIRIEVLLVQPEAEFFYADLNATFQRISASLDPAILVHRTFVSEDDVTGVARHIAKPTVRRAGLIVLAPDHPEITESIRQARMSGVEVVQLLTGSADEDVPYIGIDNYAAGRTAAYYMSSMLRGIRGTVLAMCHSGAYRAHRERIRGFSDYLMQHTDGDRNFYVVIFGHDDNLLSAERLSEALRNGDRVIGLYSVGAGREGIAAALNAHPAKVFWIGHALTQNTAKCLRSGLMDICIDGAPETQARRSLDTVLHRLGLINVDLSSAPVQFLTITAQNL
ncbi:MULTISPECIES: LacI family DNA-binding transcriptional regulator [unclassified Bradyrhizobium]|uniref:LacI family DNA-binding transcriptional regulator n=1 Tax=unclassified Bradyrhizobium TaxID=2631580 RepID=UPI0013739A8E|nr:MULTISPECIES: LacI family DNA-binding transcriptional regulator [unclassified Bradyrhizobium]MDA9490388.1 LacI family transcriptional regulator [Bradyrhizobium sp. CCBAU 11361]QHP67928.1 LacI family DNA-binding transcriptional regulator [Bradyrhizobium sp. LCT2]